MCDSLLQLFGAVNQVQSYEKNVIVGAIHDNVFQHRKESGHLKQCVQMP